MKKYSIVVLLLAMAGWAIINNTVLKEKSAKAPAKSKSDAPIGLEVSYAAPHFTLQQLDGSKVHLSDFKGKTVMLNFWATWCPPCRAEMPEMEQFYKDMKDQDVEIIAVNLTESESSIENVKTFKAEQGLSFPILLDEKGTAGSRYEIVSVPTTYFLDENGVIHFKHVGPMSYETMKDYMEKM